MRCQCEQIALAIQTPCLLLRPSKLKRSKQNFRSVSKNKANQSDATCNVHLEVHVHQTLALQPTTGTTEVSLSMNALHNSLQPTTSNFASDASPPTFQAFQMNSNSTPPSTETHKLAKQQRLNRSCPLLLPSYSPTEKDVHFGSSEEEDYKQEEEEEEDMDDAGFTFIEQSQCSNSLTYDAADMTVADRDVKNLRITVDVDEFEGGDVGQPTAIGRCHSLPHLPLTPMRPKPDSSKMRKAVSTWDSKAMNESNTTANSNASYDTGEEENFSACYEALIANLFLSKNGLSNIRGLSVATLQECLPDKRGITTLHRQGTL